MQRCSASSYRRVRYRPRALPDARFHPLLYLRNLRDSTLAKRWRRYRNPIDRIGKKQNVPFRRGQLDDKGFVPAARAQGHDGVGRDRLRGVRAHGCCKRTRQSLCPQPVVAGERAPVVAVIHATPPETIAAAGYRHTEGFVVPLREQRGALDPPAEGPAL